MAKILTIHSQDIRPGIDWTKSDKYGTHIIKDIKTPDDETDKHEVTSIPSPFARMELVKNAYKVLVDSNDLDGNTIYHKLVSDSLDVGEIFFSHNQFKDEVEIIAWDKQFDLNQLLESDNPKHRQLGKTYQIYLKQDAATFNFKDLQRIYLLNYHRGNKPLNIIGATSPATLFFTSANNLKYVGEKIRFGDDAPFDEMYKPLYKRDFEYQKYWYLLRNSFPNFAIRFPEVNSYLEACYSRLNEMQRGEINRLQEEDLSLEHLTVGAAGNNVEILGYPLKKKIIRLEGIEENSDFVIQATKQIEGHKPLVLPITRINIKLTYISAPWEKDTSVPYFDKYPLERRNLPRDGRTYPYLTIGDFLEDTLIRMPYELNSNAFFDGNLKPRNDEHKSYLLPLKKHFFTYFSPKDLMNLMSDDKPMFEMEEIINNAVKVTLRIPIRQQHYIEYSRIYHNVNNVNIGNNEGRIQEWSFSLSLFPNIQFKDDKDAYYRLALISKKFNVAVNYKIKCFADEQILPFTNEVIRNTSDQRYGQCKTCVLENSNFDYIQLEKNDLKGIIIPFFKNQFGVDQFTFAIDLGTTNTHIEYSVSGSPTKPFNIGHKDEQLVNLFKNIDDEIKYIYQYDFLPERVGLDQRFHFPIRTALSEAKETNWQQAVMPMAHVNIPFPYQQRKGYFYNRTLTNLKWSNEKEKMQKIRGYIDTLFLMLRNKVILNGGNLPNTKIVWFYPISMTQNRYNLFRQAWADAYKKYFGENIGNIISMTESEAPYKFYMESVPNANNLVSIDIGGGTSDIVFGDDGEIKHITSFRFAANSIFGDFSRGVDVLRLNGIINQFEKDFDNYFITNNLIDLIEVFKELKEEKKSSNIASFLFSLSENKDVIEKKIEQNLDFHRILQADDTYKICFIIFYVAIIYHTAQIMKAKGMQMPRHIAFSGKGSQVIRILTSEIKLLESFTKLIFEKIYKKSYHSDGLTILHDFEHPKEVTCKGGIAHQNPQDYTQMEETKITLLGVNNNKFIVKETYKDIIENEEYINKTVEEVKAFLNFTLNLNDDFNFMKNFGVRNDSLKIAREVCQKDLATYVKRSLQEKLKEVSKEDRVEESLFFYPLNGLLDALSDALFQNSLKNN